MKRPFISISFILIFLLFGGKTEAARVLNDISSDKESYTAHLTLPEGSGPFPVVVLSHGRGGAKGFYYNWGKQMTEWGFAAIAMDHYTPRGHGRRLTHGIMSTSESFDVRRDDLISILKVIKDDKRLDNTKVTLAGWSRGAGFVGHGILDQETREEAEFEHPIKAAVLIYPQNEIFFKNFDEKFNLPVILLTGNEDYIWEHGWEASWKNYKNQNHPLVLKLYEGATHTFDNPYFRKKRCREASLGPHCKLYDEGSHKQSIEDLEAFLTKYAQ
ncbi:MAG: alpha/beta hydrolase [Pseudomonadota bacterium]|nr:alpha/beta hydrolase [Pseudomonadota bacterium]